MNMTPEQFLSGGGAPAAKFETPGTRIGGRIVNDPEVRQQTDFQTREPLTWPSGDPKMQLIVDVQTGLRDPDIDDDDGVRRLYIKGKNLTNAVRDALRVVGAKNIERDGDLYVTYTKDGVPAARGISAPKEYTAEYTKPAATTTGAFLGTGQATQTAPQPVATPAAAPAPAANGGLTPEAQAALANLNPAALQALLAQAGQQP
jgi:hypothetical protein